VDGDILLKLIVVFVPMLLSLTVHECCHGLAAAWLGDDTARHQGRLTLNPLAHIDLFGTVVLPLMLIFTNSSFFFGWAKPVPVNPVNFHRHVRMKTGMMLTAAAGPLSNMGFAIVAVALMKVLLLAGVMEKGIYVLLFYTLSINLILALFNLIPFPPLDGSKVLVGLLPDRFGHVFEVLQANPWIFLVGFFVVIRFASVVIDPPYRAAMVGLLHLFGIPPEVVGWALR
jgi:Zn-dependent protease